MHTQSTVEVLDRIADDFLSRLSLPLKTAWRPFLVAVIGLIGSGHTTVARGFAERLDGAVVVSANPARFLLKEEGLPWGENVRQILKRVTQNLLSRGCGVILDGGTADSDDQANIRAIIRATGATLFSVRVRIDPAVAKKRKRAQYDDPSWISSFEHFRVNTAERMLANIDKRATLHANLSSNRIPNLVGEINNNGTLAELDSQIHSVAESVRRALER